MLLINAHEIFSSYNMYFFTDSHFAQNLKIALFVSIIKLRARYCTHS